jgi:hypothetical protein
MQATDRGNVTNMLYFLNGSVNSASMLYWITSQDDVPTQFGGTATIANGTWQGRHHDASARTQVPEDDSERVGRLRQRRLKISKNLTLNLGVRYEYYGSPYLGDGFTVTQHRSRAPALFRSLPAVTNGHLFSNWLEPGNLYLERLWQPTRQIFCNACRAFSNPDCFLRSHPTAILNC